MCIKSRCVLVALTFALTYCLCAHAQLLPPVRENPKDGLKYVWIPPGTFMMGCSPGDNECQRDEKPPHQVTITKGFWMGQTEVTVAAYRRFAGSTGAQMPPRTGFQRGLEQPGHAHRERKLG